jgi:hypothetical protein
MRQAMRRFFISPALTLAHARFRATLRRHDWQRLRTLLRPLAERARANRDHRLLIELSQAASRLEEYQLSAGLLYDARQLTGEIPPSAWKGEDVGDATLVVSVMETTKQGVAIGLESAGYIKAAAARAARTIAVVEPRLTSLFQRSLPGVTTDPFGSPTKYNGSKVATATRNDLQVIIGHDADTISRLFVPLVADREETRSLREHYLRGRTLPLIGISWWSSHYGKDLPSLEHWRRLIESVPAQFISLQYGDVAEDVAVLCAAEPERLMVDDSVDQLTNMDRFASQIAALDLVVTISNSGAHLAGALGKHMILVRDDLFRRNWPYLSRQVPWYPGAAVIGKDGRPWDVAFDEIIAAAKQISGL